MRSPIHPCEALHTPSRRACNPSVPEARSRRPAAAGAERTPHPAAAVAAGRTHHPAEAVGAEAGGGNRRPVAAGGEAGGGARHLGAGGAAAPTSTYPPPPLGVVAPRPEAPNY